MHTPWGHADHIEKIAPGIEGVSTPGHGGIHLDAAHIKRLPAAIGAGYSGSRAWWEEDCDWAVPFLLFEKEMLGWGCVKRMGVEKVRTCARETLERYNPEWLKAIDNHLTTLV